MSKKRQRLFLVLAYSFLTALCMLALRWTLSQPDRIVVVVPNGVIGQTLGRRFREEFALFEPLVKRNVGVVVQVIDQSETEQDLRQFAAKTALLRPTVVVAMSHEVAYAFLSSPPLPQLRAVIFATRDDPVELRNLAIKNGHQTTGIRSVGMHDDADRAKLVDEWLPNIGHVGVLTDGHLRSQRAVSQAREHWSGRAKISEYAASSPNEIRNQFELARRDGVSAMLIGDNNNAAIRFDVVAEAALKNRIALVSDGVVLCDAAPAVCFFSTTSSHYRRWLEATLNVLNGVPANEIPVAGTDRGVLICNVHAAQEIGVPIPGSIFLRADYAYGRIVWDRMRAQ